ncbi:putative nuclear RNA export factor SDE5 isoform X1 [Populus nigra]|uniref:putative nuclear RNA export factor SDE5 isoform X1 n=2 Tax=Populus nigra TaxID=3691 RepID=UPI002B278A02|nr:putative nuclear RNA export factor SDE5 isoform X1 [Populus nigra]XP_061977220.1 putative nuclear RNA export factor SDE5 isoform X1 [Populus nigra]
MEVSASNILKCDDEEMALKGLLEAFGSEFSLEQIASAYCKAGRNADFSVQILLDMERSFPTSSSHSSIGEAMENKKSSESSNDYIPKKKCDADEKFKTVKQKWHPVSGGTVSSVLGKSYITSMPVANSSCVATKPLKLDAQEFPMSELWGEEPKQTQSKHDHMHKDMEDFLFNMLGDGFQLERGVIQQVLDACGYDMQKSMEELLNLSGVISDKSNKYVGSSTGKFTDVQSNYGRPSCKKKLQSMSSHGGISNANRGELPGLGKERNNLQNEVLTALFSAAERSEEVSRRKTKAERRSIVYGEPVAEPLTDFTLENKADSVYSQQDYDKVSSVEDKDGEDSYQLLRKAWKEYRATMNEYYKAGGDAFAKGDYERANKLMDEGLFFRDKAHEVDEESTQKIFESKNVETQDEMLLDLHEYGTKDAIRSLRSNLLLLSGIPSFKYLKVIIELNKEDVMKRDVTKGARRRLIMKLLEKESIEWTEGDIGTILIQLDNINPKRLSFAKK